MGFKLLSLPRGMAAWPAESTKRGMIFTCSALSSLTSSCIVIGSTLKSSVLDVVMDLFDCSGLFAAPCGSSGIKVGLFSDTVATDILVVAAGMGCSEKSAEGVEMDGDDGEEEVDDADAGTLGAVPETVGGVGVLVLTPEVSDAGDTTRLDLRLPFC